MSSCSSALLLALLLLPQLLSAQLLEDMPVERAQAARLQDPAYRWALAEGDLAATLVDAAKDTFNFPELLAERQGNVVVVYTWFFNCPPCRKTIPKLRALEKKYPDQLSVIYLDAFTAYYEWYRSLPAVDLKEDANSYHVYDKKTAPLLKHCLLDSAGRTLIFDQQGRLCTVHAPWADNGLEALLRTDYFYD